MDHKDMRHILDAVSGCRLRVSPRMEERLLNLPEFKSVSTEELMYRAQVRLELARLGSIKGIMVTDRVMAIAVLVGMPDKTELGL